MTGQHISYKAISYFVLGNSSIMSITLLPIIILNLIYKNLNFKKLLLPSLLSFIVVVILSFNFNPFNWQGGGVNYMISNKVFNNNIFFYITSFITLTTFMQGLAADF
ncbi:MAG: hypothetical protein CMJ05_09520 [Pelagibacterales bacterium]|nr:hypothetical protein [Pelagibacterales bacterium]